MAIISAMILKIPDFSLPPLPVTQTLKPAHRLTIIFGAIVLAGAVVYFAVQSLRHRAHVVAGNPKERNKEIRDLYEKGLNNLKEHHLDQAETDLNQALENYYTKLSDDFRQTNDPILLGQIHYQLGVCKERKEDYNKALEKYNEALSLTKGQTIHAEISLKKGMLLETQNKELEGIITIYNQVIAVLDRKEKISDPKLYTIACLLKSHALLRKEQPKAQKKDAAQEAFEYAESAWSSAKETNPVNLQLLTEVLYQQGLCKQVLGLFGQRVFDTVLQKYEFALALAQNPYTKASILCDRALLREQHRFLSEALKDYNEALECKFTDEHILESRQLFYRAPIKVEGAPASFKNGAELKTTIQAGRQRLESIGITA